MRVFACAVGLSREAFIEELRGLVRTHRDGARQSKALRGRIVRRVLSAAPARVRLNRLPLQMIERKSHRAERCGADGDAAFKPFGKINGPTQRLHAAD